MVSVKAIEQLHFRSGLFLVISVLLTIYVPF